MSFLVVFVVNNPDNVSPVVEAWDKLGVTGVTILESTGLGHIRQTGLREDLPLMPSLHDLFESNEVQHRTLLSVVEDQETVDRMIAVVIETVGDLEEAHTGFLFVVPVLQVIGFGKGRSER